MRSLSYVIWLIHDFPKRRMNNILSKDWQIWKNKPEVEESLIKRAKGSLPEMESTKQLVRLVSECYSPGMKILDVGCNVGHYLQGLRRLDAKLDYTGVDAYEHYIEQAREIFRDDNCARFEVRDILEPLFPDEPFDIVFCCNVILHLPDFRLPVRNLLASTKKVCFIRTLLDDYTTIVKRAVTQHFDEKGNPLDFVYQNTWESSYFIEFVKQLNWNVELISDEFDVSVIEKEFRTVKKGQGTGIVNNRQVVGNIMFNWMWAKVTPMS